MKIVFFSFVGLLTSVVLAGAIEMDTTASASDSFLRETKPADFKPSVSTKNRPAITKKAPATSPEVTKRKLALASLQKQLDAALTKGDLKRSRALNEQIKTLR